jgi:hypothetical protein
MFKAITTPGGGLVFLTSPPTLGRVVTTLGRVEPAGVLCSTPVIVSGNVPTGMIVLLDADELFIAAGGFELSVSQEATLQMDDSPSMEGTTPTASTTVSLWQSGLAAFKFSRFVNWQLAHSGAVAYTILG